MVYHRYLAVPAVTEIVCIEPNPYLQKRLRAAARAVVEEWRARRGPPLSVRVYAGTLCEYADEESLVEFDAIVGQHERPPVLSAIMKLQCTELGRVVVLGHRLRLSAHVAPRVSPPPPLPWCGSCFTFLGHELAV